MHISILEIVHTHNCTIFQSGMGFSFVLLVKNTAFYEKFGRLLIANLASVMGQAL